MTPSSAIWLLALLTTPGCAQSKLPVIDEAFVRIVDGVKSLIRARLLAIKGACERGFANRMNQSPMRFHDRLVPWMERHMSHATYLFPR